MPYFTDTETSLTRRQRRGPGKRRIAGDRPYMQPEEQAALPQELEAYLSEAAIQARLEQAQYDARSNALLAAGAGILGAPDLLSGMGAAAAGFGNAMQPYQEERRNLPTEAALSRYGVQGQEQQRQMALEEAARQEAEAARQQGEYDYEMDPSRIGVRDRAAEAAAAGAESQVRGAQAMEPYIVPREVAEQAQIGANTAGIQSATGRTNAETLTENALRQPRVDLTNAQVKTEGDQGAYYRGEGRQSGSLYGDPDSRYAVSDWDAARRIVLQEAETGFAPFSPGPEQDGAIAVKQLERMRIRGTNGPDRERLEQIISDLATMDDASFDATYANDPTAAAIAAYLGWKATIQSRNPAATR